MSRFRVGQRWRRDDVGLTFSVVTVTNTQVEMLTQYDADKRPMTLWLTNTPKLLSAPAWRLIQNFSSAFEEIVNEPVDIPLGSWEDV